MPCPLAGVLLIPIVLESGVKWGFMVYAVVGILNAILTPSLEAKVLFIAFFGYYPVLKALIERIRFRPLEWAAKLLLFNGTFVAAYWLMLHVFALPADSLELFGVNVPLLLLGAGEHRVCHLRRGGHQSHRPVSEDAAPEASALYSASEWTAGPFSIFNCRNGGMPAISDAKQGTILTEYAAAGGKVGSA